MNIKEIDEIRLPNSDKKMNAFRILLKQPMSATEAKQKLSRILRTPNLTAVLDTQEIENPEKDIRKEIIEYLDAEYPQISVKFKKYSFINDQGVFSTLGNEQTT